MQEHNTYDAIVIGAGLGGLLSAAQLLQRSKRVVVLERLPHCGGRFTAKTFQGVQVSTGAVHMVPFGSSGVLAEMLRRLHIPHHFFDADVFASFHVHGKQVRTRGLLGTIKFLGLRQFFWFTRVGYLMFLRHLPAQECDLPFDTWLARHIDVKRNRELTAFFERISRFALSLELSQVSTAEVIKTTKNMFRYGAPGIVQGGCAALTGELERCLLVQGAELRLRSDVLQIHSAEGHVTGVRVRDKASGEESLLYAPLVVSDIGPRATTALLNNRQVTQAQVLKQTRTTCDLQAPGTREGCHYISREMNTGDIQAPGTREGCHYISHAMNTGDIQAPGTREGCHYISHAMNTDDLQEAIGLKVHIISDVSLIPHKGIMYCLDTQRIAGMVQPTNCDPRLAPEGKHLLISHQVMQSNNIDEEKALALADLRMMFGETFEKHCRILTMSAYRGEWPVNRVAQGEDVASETAVPGLYMVGDAVKPAGYLMVEGVAQSVNQFLNLLDAMERGKAEGSPRRPIHSGSPSRFNAIRWLWEAPGNS